MECKKSQDCLFDFCSHTLSEKRTHTLVLLNSIKESLNAMQALKGVYRKRDREICMLLTNARDPGYCKGTADSECTGAASMHMSRSSRVNALRSH